MENKIYQIIIACLLVLLVVILVKGQTGRYQISLNNCLDTKTGEIYVLERVEASDNRGFLWYYVGRPRKDINSEEITTKIIKNIQQKEVR